MVCGGVSGDSSDVVVVILVMMEWILAICVRSDFGSEGLRE